MAIAAPFRPSFNPQPKEVIRHADKRRKQRDEQTAIDRVYREVDARDGRLKCRCCGRHPSKGGGHTHNHLRPRSLATQVEKHTPKNVHGCCLECNLLLKNGKIRVTGRDCTKPLAFAWTSLATRRERHGLTLRDERVTS